MKEFGLYMAIVVFCILGLLVCIHIDVKHGEKDFQEKLNTYSIIVINGNDYNTKDIIDYEIHARAYESDMIEVTFKDGSKLYFPNNDYGLKREE